MTSRAMRPFSLTVPPETFRLVTTARMSFSERVGVEGNLGPLEHAQEFVLVGEQALEEAVERRVAGSAFEDAVEAGSEFERALRARGGLERLELTDRTTRSIRRATSTALRCRSLAGMSLWTRRSAVNPAQSVVADAELSGVVGEDDGAGEPILGADCAPQRAFAGHAHGIGRDPQSVRPSARRCARQSASQANSRTSAPAERIDDAVRQIGRVHIGRRRRIDRVARRPAQEIAQEGEARFARSRAERGEPVGAELRRVAGLAGVARSGVVDADVSRGAKPGAEAASSSARNRSSLAVKSRTTWRFEIERPAAVSKVTIRSQVIWP